ncbi:hypothetical protein HRM2_12850 [Desulforapulum autotrophicum HRM2]|uniref:Uncharacterized protein n=1 Tax=Desulforapulum autotrophicum (strain ATCC 43914 / DSM 3382 / VKM B-1955 / HRM2) TaxID=177437 RepID=C0Q8Q6_DESAH|nr:hypothetical protein HRM2_12850 [Desulforapulum autotrophicum HRM2]
MEILKCARPTPDFCLVSRRVNGSILKDVRIDVTQKTGKKTS